MEELRRIQWNLLPLSFHFLNMDALVASLEGEGQGFEIYPYVVLILSYILIPRFNEYFSYLYSSGYSEVN